VNHTYKILKYLYKNNDGKEHPVQFAYCENKLPSRELLWDKIKELGELGYIEPKHNIDDDVHGLLDINRRYPREFGTLPDNKHTLYQIKIISKGESYIDDRTVKVCRWIVRKNDFFIVSITGIVILVTTIINIIINLLF